MTEPIVVTGATGRVGHLVVEELLALGCRVRAVGRTMEKLRPLAERGADVRAGGPRAYEDREFLATVFNGARAAFVLTPVDVAAEDVNKIQYKIIDGLVSAIRDSSVKHVVLLSSWGAELETQVGGIIACHRFEELLDQISELNVVHLRPVWFMENFLWNIPLIKMAGINGLAFKSNVSFPTIATRDIAPIAARYLAKLDFRGRNIHYLNGARDYTMTEITRILGESIGRPHLKYVEFPNGVFRKGLLSAGLSPNAADFAVQINRGIDSRLVRAEARSASNTTPTTVEDFAKSTFAPAFNAAPEPGFGDRFGGFFLRSFLLVTGHLAVYGKSR